MDKDQTGKTDKHDKEDKTTKIIQSYKSKWAIQTPLKTGNIDKVHQVHR